ncbi:MAG: TetR/AcrR family transcriptional regulator [Thermoanaerobaculia bacterium]
MAEKKTPSPFVRELKDDTPVELSSHDRILLSARALFSSQGYENATTSAIARMAGTSESQLIKHFGSKEGLLAAIFDQSWQRFAKGLAQVLPKCQTPYDKLRALIDLILDAMERDKDLRTLMLLEGRRIRKHGSMVVLTDGFLNMVSTVDGLLAEMRDSGQLRSDLDVQAVRSALIGAYEGLLRDQILADRGNYPASYGSEDLRKVLQVVLDCFGPK